jgi:hypothetical protein
MDHSIPRNIFEKLEDLRSLYLKSLAVDNSFAGEFKHLKHLMASDNLNIDSGYVVDMAASDGVSQSCTLEFFKDVRWHGLAVEMDAAKFAKLSFIYSNFPNAKLARGRVTPQNVSSLLDAFEVPRKFTLLNLDIDSYDLHVLSSILNSGYKPTIISMEVNEKIPPPIYFTVNYNDSHYWHGDHFYGCSLVAAAQTVKPFGYVLESLQYNNAFFIDSDIAAGKIIDSDVHSAYFTGYAAKADRLALFPYNANVDCLLTMNKDDSIKFINEFFSIYAGLYTIE